jgi:hypothetical protein
MSVDRGVHVANVSKHTGEVLEVLVAPVSVSMEVSIHRKVAAIFTRFRLVMYANTDMHPRMLYTRDLMLDMDKKAHVACEPNVRTRGAHTVYFRLFGSRITDGALTQELLASGSTCANAAPVVLWDIEHNTVAHVTIAGFPFDAQARKMPVPFNFRARELITEVTTRQLVLRTETEQGKPAEFVPRTDTFPLVNVHSLPIIWFAYHASCMTADSNHATAYFERLLAVAARMQIPGSSKFQLLADMLSLPSLAWVYRSDTNSLNVDGEYWASLWSNPPDALQAFDCEDGAKALLELYHVLREVPLTDGASPALREMQQLVQRYRGFLAIGELYQPADNRPEVILLKDRIPADYVMHCYCMLLPLTADSGVPAITLDSTSYSSTAWSYPLLDCPKREEEKDQEEEDVDPLVCERNSPAHVQKHGMYGALVTLMTSQRGSRTEHFLMRRVNTFEFFKAPSFSSAICCFSKTDSEIGSIFKHEMECCPGSIFPTPASDHAALALPASWRSVLKPASGSHLSVVALSKHDALFVV